MSTSVVLEHYPSDTVGVNTRVKSLKRQRVYIFPTMQGWIYGVMLVVMLLGAINYNNSMAFMLCFLLAGLGLICMLHTYRNLTGLIVSSKRPNAVYAGQQALFPIHLDNRLGTTRFSIRFHQRKASTKWYRRPQIIDRVSVTIPAKEQYFLQYPCLAETRGILKLGKLMISSCFPLGIFKAWSYFDADTECIVYPNPYGNKLLPPANKEDEDADFGDKTGTDDFAGFRKYRPGDPINTIAWKVFAREQGLLVKQFSGDGSEILMLTWQAVSNLNDIEARLSQLCYWIIIADKYGMQYGLEIPNIQIEPAYGSKHKDFCLEQLARYGKIDASN